MSQSNHPTSDKLQQLAQGLLDEVEFDLVKPHLQDCDTCLAYLETVPSSPFEQKITDLRAQSDETRTVEPNRAAPETAAPPYLRALGNYFLTEQIGEGGMGVVYKARDKKLGRYCVVKTIKPKYANVPEFGERFEREARILAQFTNDHIVAIHDLGKEPEYFMVLTLLDGKTLEKRLRNDGALPINEVLRLGREIVRGLKAVHDKNIIHRDLKPDNLYLEDQPDQPGRPRIKILDFGLARLAEDETNLTNPGHAVGTPGYMAPEQFNNPEQLDPRADLFSLGCVLYRMATGKLPFPREYDPRGKWTPALSEQWQSELRDPACTPIPPCELNPAVPRALNDLIVKLLQKDRVKRYGTVSEVQDALDGVPDARPQPAQVRADAPPDKTPTAATQIAPTLEISASAGPAIGAPESRQPRVGCRVAVSIAICLALLAPLAFFMFQRGANETAEEKLVKEKLALLEELAAVYEGIKDKKSSDDAQPRIKALHEKRVLLDQQLTGLHAASREAALERNATKLNTALALLASAETRAAKAAQADNPRSPQSPETEDKWILQKGETISCLAVASASNLMASGDGVTVRYWDIETGKELKQKSKDKNGNNFAGFTSIGISPKGAPVFVGSNGEWFGLRVWDPEADSVTNALPDRNMRPRSFWISRDGLSLFVIPWPSEEFGMFRLPRPGNSMIAEEKWIAKPNLKVEDKWIPCLGLSADGKRALFSDQGYVFVLDSQKNTLFSKFPIDLAAKEATSKKKASATFVDGSHIILTGEEEQTFALLDIEISTKLRDFKGHTDKILTLAVSPDGKRALTGSRDTTIRLWDLAKGTSIELRGHADDVTHVAFTFDGRFAISAGKDKTLRKWKLPQAPPPSSDREVLRKDHIFTHLAVPAAGDCIIAGGADGVVRALRLKDGFEIAKVTEAVDGVNVFKFGAIFGLSVSPDGNQVLITGGLNQRAHSLFFWDRAAQSVQHFSRLRNPSLQASYNNPSFSAISADGTYVAFSTYMEKGVGLFRLPNWDNERSYSAKEDKNAQQHSGGRLALSRNAHRLLTLSRAHVQVWDQKNQSEPIFRTKLRGGGLFEETLVALSPNGDRALVSEREHSIRVFDVNAKRDEPLFQLQHGNVKDGNDLVVTLAISPDGRRVLSGGRDKTVRLWDLASGTEIAKFTEHTETITSVVFTPDGHYAISAGEDKTLRRWKLPHPLETVLAKLGKDGFVLPHDADIRAFAISPSGTQAATACADGSVLLWDLAARKAKLWPKGQWKPELKPAGEPVSHLAFLSEDEIVVCVRNHATINNGLLWKVNDDSCEPRPYPTQGERKMLLHYLPPRERKGPTLIVRFAINLTAHLEHANGSPICSLGCETGMLPMHSVPSLSADGKRVLANRSGEGRWNLWDTDKPDAPIVKEYVPQNLARDAVVQGLLSPDGQRAAFALNLGKIVIWDFSKHRDKALVGELAKHAGPARCMAFAPAGNRLVSGGPDGKVVLWDLDAMKIIDTLSEHKAPISGIDITPDGQYVLWTVDKNLNLRKLPAPKIG